MAIRCALIALAIAPLGALMQPLAGLAQLAMMNQTPDLERLEIFLGRWHRGADQAPAGGPSPVAADLDVAWGPGAVWMTWEAEIQFATGETLYRR